ncbi:MAG: hypothetical protein H6509_01165 [Bryobacterales bacterium]|nr:hypothetical protein [Acidobacteriota bacterium]MCB9383195.1 hypothetical protein [Bryobacterales bacterium]
MEFDPLAGPSLEDVRRARKAWMAEPPRGYLLMFDEEDVEQPHVMAGDHHVPGAECPTCNKPLMRLLTLDTSRLPFVLDPAPPAFLHLFYCWTCAIPFDFFAYRIDDSGGVEIVSYLKEYSGAFGPEGPYDGYTGVFPEARASLRPLTDEEEERVLLLRAEQVDETPEDRLLNDVCHQIGGFPMIFNEMEEVLCPACSAPAPFFATICDNVGCQGNNYSAEHTFTGNIGVQMVFHWCGPCSVMTAYHSCG